MHSRWWRLHCKKGSCCCSWLCQGWSEPGHCSFPTSSILRSAAARLPGPVSRCCRNAPAASASSQCSSFVQLVFVQCCSSKCLWQLWHAGRGASLCIPAALLTWKRLSALVLLHPGLLSLPAAHPPHGDALGQPWARSCPTRSRGASGSRGAKQTLLSTSITARGEQEHCCHSLCCLTSFSQIRSGRSKEMVNSAREFVFCHGRYKPGKEEHSLTVATFAFSGFPSRI